MRKVAAPLLAQILDPLRVEEFVGRYFERRPLLVRGPPEKFDFLLRANEFESHLERAESIRAVFPGFVEVSIAPHEIDEMMRAGASICVTGLDRAHGRLRRTAGRIRSQLHYFGKVDFRAYRSPPGGGFDLHYDARVATTLQIAANGT